MRAEFVKTYSDLMKKHFGVEPQFKRRFQIQLIEWRFFGENSGGSRMFIVFPVKAGERILVEIRKDARVRVALKKLLKEWKQAVVTKDFEKYQQTLFNIFQFVLANKVHVYREITEGDILRRERIESMWGR